MAKRKKKNRVRRRKGPPHWTERGPGCITLPIYALIYVLLHPTTLIFAPIVVLMTVAGIHDHKERVLRDSELTRMAALPEARRAEFRDRITLALDAGDNQVRLRMKGCRAEDAAEADVYTDITSDAAEAFKSVSDVLWYDLHTYNIDSWQLGTKCWYFSGRGPAAEDPMSDYRAARRDVHEWLVALGGDFPIPDEIDDF